MESNNPQAGLMARAINFGQHCIVGTLLIGLSALGNAKPPDRLLHAAGTIYCDGKVRGSAVYISPPQEIADIADDVALALTAAHTLFDLQSGQPYKACEYRPQNKRLSGIALSRVSQHGYQTTDSDKIAQAEQDIAFLMLSHHPAQPALQLRQQSPPISGPLTIIAYHAKLGDITTSEPCQPVDTIQPPNSALLLHNCQAGAGTSGAPIFNLNSGELVAIHGGALVFDRADEAQPLAAIDRDQVDLSLWINQGRLIDNDLIEMLMDFIQSTP